MSLILPALKWGISGREEGIYLNPEFLLQNTHYEVGIWIYYAKIAPNPLRTGIL